MTLWLRDIEKYRIAQGKVAALQQWGGDHCWTTLADQKVERVGGEPEKHGSAEEEKDEPDHIHQVLVWLSRPSL